MPARDYQHEKFSVHGSFVLVAVLLLFMIILAFPFIKSLLMSPEETLNTSDILMTLMALFMLCFFYVYLHMYTFDRTGQEYKEREAILAGVGETISKSFVQELDSAWQQLDLYDAAFAASANVQSDSMLGPADALRYKNFKRVFWLNKNGNQLAEWRKSGDRTTDAANYSSRNYFKAVQSNKLWNIDGVGKKTGYLDPLFSWKDGNFRAVLSKPSHNRDALVAAISADMRSVIHVTLPPEINFSIVDASGRVLFTSAGREHLDENMIEECNQNSKLRAAINMRGDAFFTENYLSSSCNFHVAAIENLPLHTITWTNKHFSRNAHLQIFIFSFMMLLGLMIMFGLALLVFILTKKHPPLIKRPLIDLRWAYPASKFTRRDIGSVGINLFLLLLSFAGCYAWWNQPVTLLLLFILNTGVSIASFSNARLQFSGIGGHAFRVGLILFFVVIDFLLFRLNSHNALICFLFYEVLLYWIIYRLKRVDETKGEEPLLTKINRKIRLGVTLQFYHIYALQLATWFMLISMLPTACYFRYFYQEENRDTLKYMQLELARRFSENPGETASLAAYHETSLYTEPALGDGICAGVENSITEKQMFHDALNIIRFAVNTSGVAEMQAGLLGGKKHNICFTNDGDYQTLRYRSLAAPGNTVLVIKSRIPKLVFPTLTGNPVLFIIYFLVPVVFLVLFYGFILVFLKRFFMFGFFPQKKVNEQQKEFNGYFYEKLQSDKLRLFVLGVPASGKNELVEKAMQYTLEKRGLASVSAKDCIVVHDMAELDVRRLGEIIDACKKDKNKIVLLKHFEHNLTDKTESNAKFRLIAGLFQGKVKHLVILSSIHPSVFLNNLQKNNTIFNAEDYINMQEYYNWSGLLSGFEVYTKSLSLHHNTNGEQENAAENYNSYVQNVVTSSIGRMDNMAHDNAYASYQLSYLYYRALWNSLDRLEKFVMYDLAQDDLANFRNRHGLLSLYNKGLIVNNDIPSIMDQSLRNFILAEIKDSDIELEKKEAAGAGAWTKFRTPFLIIIIVVMFFIFITQQESFNKLLAIITAFTAGIPALMKLFTLIPSSNKQN